MQEIIAKIILYIGIITFSFITGMFAKDISFINNFLTHLNSGLAAIMEASYPDKMDGSLHVKQYDDLESHNGYLLLTYHYKNNPAILLVNNQGKTIYSWNIAKEITNEKLANYFAIPENKNELIYDIADAHLLKNGDLVATQNIVSIPSYRGQRMVRVAANSEIIWQINDSFHHDIFLDEKENIYALTLNFRELPKLIWHSSKVKTPLITDDIIKVITPNGKIIAEYSIIDGILNSKFANYLASATIDLGHQEFTLKDGRKSFDLLHVNYVQYISKKLALANEFFQEGDFLISFRGISAIGIYRPSLEKFIYLRRGPWRHQHYVKLQEDGLIYIYDNDGGSKITANKNETKLSRSSRVISYNIKTEESEIIIHQPQHYDNYSYWRGYYIDLEDGSKIFTSSDTGRIMQIKNNKVIWELRTVKNFQQKQIPYTRSLSSIKYYKKSQILPLLNQNKK